MPCAGGDPCTLGAMQQAMEGVGAHGHGGDRRSPLDGVFLGAGAWESTRDVMCFWSLCSGIPLRRLALRSHQKCSCEMHFSSLPVLRSQVERSL